MKISIIIPTYNERETIKQLLDELRVVTRSLPEHVFTIVVVDAHSPDGTADIAHACAKVQRNIHVLVEDQRRGLGAAYARGFRYAIENLAADVVVEFDGDFQHRPADLPRLIAALDEGYDYVIGSRYISGGEIPPGWSWYRRFLSRLGGGIVRRVLGLSIRDATSGFKISRVRGFAEHLPLNERLLLSRHHAYKIHFLHEMIDRGARVKEVPIAFLDRRTGSSKSTLRDIHESLKVVFLLWARKQSARKKPFKNIG